MFEAKCDNFLQLFVPQAALQTKPHNYDIKPNSSQMEKLGVKTLAASIRFKK